MNANNIDQRALYIKERNQKIASILVLVITIFEKVFKTFIQDRKAEIKIMWIQSNRIFALEHIWGTRFDRKGIFGYLCKHVFTQDIHSFLGNDSIRDKDILILFSRLGDQGLGRLTYLGYLALLKPYFDYELARDLLLRDTVVHRSSRGT